VSLTEIDVIMPVEGSLRRLRMWPQYPVVSCNAARWSAGTHPRNSPSEVEIETPSPFIRRRAMLAPALSCARAASSKSPIWGRSKSIFEVMASVPLSPEPNPARRKVAGIYNANCISVWCLLVPATAKKRNSLPPPPPLTAFDFRY
jgi:hypothetical protein